MDQRSGLIDQCPPEMFERLTINQPECDWIPVNYAVLGKGVKGYTFQVCCHGDCRYIVKKMTNKQRKSSFKDSVVREIRMQQRFQAAGVAPRLLDAFSCGDDFYLVMDKMDYTIEKLFEDVVVHKYNLETALRIKDMLLQEVFALIEQAARNRLVHDDLKLDNIMVNIDEEDGEMYLTDVKMIDFGFANAVSSYEAAKVHKLQNDIELSFDNLTKKIIDMYQHQTARKPRRTIHGVSPVRVGFATPYEGTFNDLEPMTPIKGVPSASRFKTKRTDTDDEDDEESNFKVSKTLSFDDF